MADKPSFKRARPSTATTEELFAWVTDLVSLTEQFPRYRRMGTEGDAACRAWIKQTLIESGGVNVEEQRYTIPIRNYDEWRLVVDGDDIECYFINGAAYTDPKGVGGELIHVGASIDPSMDLSGKIAVFDLKSGPALKGKAIPHIADFAFDPQGILPDSTVGGTGGPAPSNFPAPYYEAARLGAVGFIAVFRGRPSNSSKFFADPTGMVQTRIPGVFLDGTEGEKLIERIAKESTNGTIVLRGEALEAESGNLVVHVPGQKSDAMIVNTHHDGGWSGAVQDASGVAVVMGLASYYSRFPSNYIQKDLYFVIDGCHYGWNYPYGANKFAELCPDVMARTVLTFGVEHIAKRFVGENGKLVDTGEIEPRFVWVPRNQMLFDATVSGIEKNQLQSTIVPKPGAIPLYGETQSYFLQGIPSFSIMSMPEYLFFDEDTIDKVPPEELSTVMNFMLDLMDAAMYMPRNWLSLIDR